MSLLTILEFAHSLLEETIQSDDHVIDATVGNGHDTVFLASLVGENGHVYGFDIQHRAIQNTHKRLQEHGLDNRVTLYEESHEQIRDIVGQKNKQIRAAVFNLGYLPGGDKSVVTKPESTIRAIEAAFDLLLPKGRIVLVVYPGHEEGKMEKDQLLSYVKTIDQRVAHVLKYEFINQVNDPPFVICIEKRRRREH